MSSCHISSWVSIFFLFPPPMRSRRHSCLWVERWACRFVPRIGWPVHPSIVETPKRERSWGRIRHVSRFKRENLTKKSKKWFRMRSESTFLSFHVSSQLPDKNFPPLFVSHNSLVAGKADARNIPPNTRKFCPREGRRPYKSPSSYNKRIFFPSFSRPPSSLIWRLGWLWW